MTERRHYANGPVRIVSSYALDERDIALLCACFANRGPNPHIGEPQASDAPTALGGRMPVARTSLSPAGPVVVKRYARGGVLGKFVRDSYLGLGRCRCQAEFDMLVKLHAQGFSVPEPIACARKGRLVYQGLLVTREIEQAQTLAELSASSPGPAVEAMKALCKEVALLVGLGILHADFHPGNVLVDGRGKAYLVDFDKAAHYKGSKAALKGKYKKRWCRAVRKHSLPAFLCEALDI